LVERLTDLSVISTFANSFIELQKKSFREFSPLTRGDGRLTKFPAENFSFVVIRR
jgi:hypothetical protein